jgi:hypothetical protein
MGRNFYIYISLKSNNRTYRKRVCHIGRNCSLDLISLEKFFRCFVPEDIDDYFSDYEDDTLSEHQLLLQLNYIKKKINHDTLMENNVVGFRKLLESLYTQYVSNDFICEDEYGTKMTFSEILDLMSSSSHITYERRDKSDYIIDGIYVDNETKFF